MLKQRKRARRGLAARCSILWIVSLLGCSSEPPLSVVLITVDTLRADALDPYRPDQAGGERTPRISQLAAGSTLFERASAPMSLTRPSHFSIFTGRYPREHGVLNNQIALPDEESTLAEILRDRGYHTGAFVGVNLLGVGSGALQGFDFHAAPQSQLEWPAPRVVAQASEWLDGLPVEAPFFLWVHLFDPHQPYDPPDGYREGLDPALAARYPSLGWAELIQIAERNGGQISSDVLDYGRSLYRAEVAAVDASVGRLLDQVDAVRARDRVMIVFTADHGECFENGIFFEHSDCLFEGGIRVPLLVRHPPQFGAGRRMSNLVSNMDIAPTVLRAVGLAVPDSMTVPPLQESDASGERYVLLQNPFYQPEVIPARLHRQVVIRRVAGEPVAAFDAGVQTLGVVSGDWKFLRSAESVALYANGVAQAAEVNVALRNRSARVEMGETLDRALESHPLKVIAPGDINPELMQSLRALGYVE
ncbi:MAG: sulfatase [Deltaproteobacteria bacterium]|nr:sulfatase [Deltaproteobacteria bacterium]